MPGRSRCGNSLNFVREQLPPHAGLPIRRVLNRVRQLVLLAEERDLRQVPAAALGMNAVRLMTVHGSKGLEFEAVHVPGLTVASFPSSNRGHRCPAPAGMIEGTENLTVPELAKRAHDQEEECLFFVAVSRARTHVCVHLSRRQPNGNNRNASPFLGWIAGNIAVEDPASGDAPPRAPTGRAEADAYRRALAAGMVPYGQSLLETTTAVLVGFSTRTSWDWVPLAARRPLLLVPTTACTTSFDGWRMLGLGPSRRWTRPRSRSRGSLA